MFRTILRNNTIVSSLYWFIAAIIFLMWIWGADSQGTSFNGDARSTFSGIIQGTAHKPFVERALVPILTNVTYHFIPVSIWSNLSSSFLQLKLKTAIQ